MIPRTAALDTPVTINLLAVAQALQKITRCSRRSNSDFTSKAVPYFVKAKIASKTLGIRILFTESERKTEIYAQLKHEG